MLGLTVRWDSLSVLEEVPCVVQSDQRRLHVRHDDHRGCSGKIPSRTTASSTPSTSRCPARAPPATETPVLFIKTCTIGMRYLLHKAKCFLFYWLTPFTRQSFFIFFLLLLFLFYWLHLKPRPTSHYLVLQLLQKNTKYKRCGSSVPPKHYE